MKLKWIVALGVILLTIQVSAEDLIFKTQKDKSSYAVGVDIARNFKRQEIEVDVDLLIKGLKDELSGQNLLLTEKDLQKTLSVFQSEVRRRQRELRQKQMQVSSIAEDNKKTGEAFLAQNKMQEGVVTLPSGLQYKILKESEGKKPTEADTVECHYRGTFINRTEFDSSYKRGQPATFKVKEIMPGWREALKLMPVGSKWQLFIPPELAYRARGSGRIPPNSTLIFEVELISVK